MLFVTRKSQRCCGYTGILLTFTIIILVPYSEKLFPEQQPRDHPQPFLRQGNVPVEVTPYEQNIPRKIVIILTNPGHDSNLLGNAFNLHPDVFYLYEPLHDLSLLKYGKDYRVLKEGKNKAFRSEISRLIRDSFSCNFHEESTRNLIFSPWIRRYRGMMAWRLDNPKVTQSALQSACQKRKVTVAKIMQTRLPGKVGIEELLRVCEFNPELNCSIIHLVRDPRAVISSLIETNQSRGQAFHEKSAVIVERASVLCSEVKDNLNFVKARPSVFRGRYTLIRYEDVVKNAPKTVQNLYDFAKIPMVVSILDWMLDDVPVVQPHVPPFPRKTFAEFRHSKRGSDWRMKLDPALVSMLEERCGPLMKLLGYSPVRSSEKRPSHLSKNR